MSLSHEGIGNDDHCEELVNSDYCRFSQYLDESHENANCCTYRNGLEIIITLKISVGEITGY